MTLPTVLALFGGLGTWEILFIVLIIMLLFGAAKIPELARSLGKAQREFQRARDEIEREASKTPAAPAAASSAASGAFKASDTDEARIRTAAESLGIATQGKTVEELRTEIARKMAEHSPKE